MAKHAEKTESTYRNLSENWKTVVAQGVVALAIGIVIVAVPNLSTKVVSILLGALLLVYAILSFVGAGSAKKESQPTTWLYVRGALAAAGGLIILFWPSLKDLGLLYILGVFAIAVGVFIGFVGMFQKWDRGYKVIGGFGGLVSVAFGVILISYASSFSDSIVWIVGLYAIAFGLLLIVLGMGARGMGKSGR